MDARNFDTKKALKNIRLYRELLDKAEKHIIEYEVAHDFPGKNPKSADFDCERYIREKDLQYIKDEIREAYKAGFMFLLHNPELMGSAEKQE